MFNLLQGAQTIELKAQDKYMGKNTGIKQQYWSPEEEQR